MKLHETSLNTAGNNKNGTDLIDDIGDEHVSTSAKTPLRSDAFDLTDEEKMAKIEYHFGEIMKTLGLDLGDDSLKGTPRRVAKMYVKEIFHGLNPENKPLIKLFENKFQYSEMLIEKNISVNSHCEHHFVPITGKAHVAYVSSGNVIGLSKINRIVRYYSQRPQVQERLTEQIAEALKNTLRTDDVAVVIDAEHMCVSMRGIEDPAGTTITAHYSGIFKRDEQKRNEFLNFINKQ